MSNKTKKRAFAAGVGHTPRRSISIERPDRREARGRAPTRLEFPMDSKLVSALNKQVAVAASRVAKAREDYRTTPSESNLKALELAQQAHSVALGNQQEMLSMGEEGMGLAELKVAIGRAWRAMGESNVTKKPADRSDKKPPDGVCLRVPAEIVREVHRVMSALAGRISEDAARHRAAVLELQSRNSRLRKMLGLGDAGGSDGMTNGNSQPPAQQPRDVRLYTSSTSKSRKTRTDERRMRAILAAKRLPFDVIFLDLYPERWTDIEAATGGSRDLPILCIRDITFTLDEIQSMEDAGVEGAKWQSALRLLRLSAPAGGASTLDAKTIQDNQEGADAMMAMIDDEERQIHLPAKNENGDAGASAPAFQFDLNSRDGIRPANSASASTSPVSKSPSPPPREVTITMIDDALGMLDGDDDDVGNEEEERTAQGQATGVAKKSETVSTDAKKGADPSPPAEPVKPAEPAKGKAVWGSWSQPDAKSFKVRGPDYLSSSKRPKVPSTELLFPLQNVEALRVEGGILNDVCGREDGWWQQNRRPGEFCLAFNIQIKAVKMSVVTYHVVRGGLAYVDKECPRVGKLLRELISMGEGDKKVRDSRFKFIPKVVKGPWIVRCAVKEKPVIMGEKVSQKYVSGDSYFELDVHVDSSSIAATIIKLAHSYSTSIEIDLAWLIEAKAEPELPERLLAATRVSYMSFKAVPGPPIVVEKE